MICFQVLPKIRGLVDERIAIIHEVEVDADVCGGGIEGRRRDAGNRAPRRKSGNILGDVDPVCGAIFGVPDLTVVGAGPDESLLHLGRSDGENDFSVELSEVVSDDSARGHDASRVLGGKIGADNRPTLPAVRGFEHHLAAVVDGVVVEGIDGERRRPMAAILEYRWVANPEYASRD